MPLLAGAVQFGSLMSSFRHKVAMLRLRDRIHGVAIRSREYRLQLSLLGGSHAASPLRWRGSFRGSFGKSFAAICFSFLYRLYPCVQRLQFGLLHFLPPLLAFVTPCVWKPSLSTERILACLVSVQGAQDSRGPL